MNREVRVAKVQVGSSLFGEDDGGGAREGGEMTGKRGTRKTGAAREGDAAVGVRVDMKATSEAGLLAGLNAAQSQCVTYDGKALVVLAGPGTGKTRVITHRIAWLVQERGVSPDKIVAATFTVKAARELRERLGKLLSPVQAERVRASTLHGLGANIVRRFGAELGLPSKIVMIDPAQRRRIVKRAIETLGIFEAERIEGISAIAERVEKMISRLADSGVLPSRAMAFASEQRANGAKAFRGVQDERPADVAMRELEHFEQFARAYEAVCKECWKRGLLSFHDLLLLPLKLLRENAGVRALVQSEVKALVIDEFQDCNAGQIEFAKLICPPGASGGSICVVGDDDQAIYAFRGADQFAFERFAEIWAEHDVITLDTNYRSGTAIIGAGNSIITKAHHRFRPDKTMRARTDAGSGAAELISLDEEKGDAPVIAAMIVMDRKQRLAAGEDVSWSDYAVIARTHGHLDHVAGTLSLEGVPWERQREMGVLSESGVQDVLAWVEWLLTPQATWCVRRILTRAPYGLDSQAVLQWELAYRDARKRAELGAEGVTHPGEYGAWLSKHLETAGTTAAATAVRVIAMYELMRRELLSMPGDEALERIMQRTGAAHAEFLSQRERAVRVRALVTLLGLARTRRGSLDAPGDLRSFWNYFNELQEADPNLRSVGQLGEPEDAVEKDEETDGADGDGPGKVQLLTAHSSKGLEFDTVFVCRCNPPHGYPMKRMNDEDQTLPDGLVAAAAMVEADAAHQDEERRLFYVACTRAKRRLVLLAKHKGKKSTSAMHLYEELLDAKELQTTRVRGSDVLAQAERAGVRVSGRDELTDAQESGGEARDVYDAMRREARLRAAAACEQAESVGATDATELASAQRVLAVTATQLALVAALEKGAEESALRAMVQRHSDGASLEMLDAALERGLRARRREARVEAAHGQLRAVKPPLRLSFSSLDAYGRCPRCWYLRYVVGLPESESDPQQLGNAAHAALERFYKAWAVADAEGQPKPALHDLLRIGKSALLRELALTELHEREATLGEQLGQLSAQLTTCYRTLHDDSAMVLETERTVVFPYVVDGVEHTFTAKIDRVDQLPSGGFRVIDYKAGQAWKKLLEPKADDLQMGVYAMAIAHAYGGGAGAGTEEVGKDRTLAGGQAEYWCLAAGAKGVLPFESMRLDKVRAKIDGVVRSMLAGEFDREPTCEGACSTFGT